MNNKALLDNYSIQNLHKIFAQQAKALLHENEKTVKGFLANSHLCNSSFSKLQKQGGVNANQFSRMMFGLAESIGIELVVKWVEDFLTMYCENMHDLVELIVGLTVKQGEAQAEICQEKQKRIKETEKLKEQGAPCDEAVRRALYHARETMAWMKMIPSELWKPKDQMQLMPQLQLNLEEFITGYDPRNIDNIN